MGRTTTRLESPPLLRAPGSVAHEENQRPRKGEGSFRSQRSVSPTRRYFLGCLQCHQEFKLASSLSQLNFPHFSQGTQTTLLTKNIFHHQQHLQENVQSGTF